MKQVILGIGAAGVAAARTIRGISDTDEITIISKDHLVQSRCLLHRYISGERSEEELSFVDKDFFSKNRIEWIRGQAVKDIEPESKTIILEQDHIHYDQLLIATGSNSVIPPIGALRTAQNVFGLRHINDAKSMVKNMDSIQNVVVIGSGLVGLEAAYALMTRGKTVQVVEMLEQVLPLYLDDHGARTYQMLFEEHGCQFHLGKRVNDTIIDSSGNITDVKLSDGTVLKCDMVLVATGIKPSTSFIQNNNIDMDGGILVDDNLRTNQPSIFAAGDVTGLSGIWPNAAKQGVVAGKNMCGKVVEYKDKFANKNTINFYGLHSLALGYFDTQPGDIVKIREDRNRYQKVIIRDNTVASVVIQGDISCSGFWLYLIKNKIKLTNINQSIWNLSYADFYAMDKRGEYMWAM